MYRWSSLPLKVTLETVPRLRKVDRLTKRPQNSSDCQSCDHLYDKLLSGTQMLEADQNVTSVWSCCMAVV